MINLKLLPFQAKGVKFLTSHAHALLADAPGLGKTIQVIAALKEIEPLKTVIVCPAHLRKQWKAELDRWTGFQSVVGGYEPLTRSMKGAQVLIISYEGVTTPAKIQELRLISPDVVVFDEAHYLKELTSSRTRACLSNRGAFTNPSRKWCLTGTPILNRPIELFPILKALRPDLINKYPRYHDFGERFGDPKWDPFKKEYVFKGASNLDELSDLIQPFILRRTKEEAGEEMPSKIYKDHYVEVPEGSIKISQLGPAKLNALQKVVKDIPGKIVVFYRHWATADALFKKLEPGSGVRFDSSLTLEEREENFQKFLTQPTIHFFCGGIRACGIGLNGLQTVARTAIFLELDWSPGVMEQAEDRLCRIGAMDPTIEIHRIIAYDSEDEAMVATLKRKQKYINTILKED